MAMKQTGRKVYKTMQGKTVDMDLLRQRNELTPAVGNVRVNARGDELGAGGKIIKKREDVMKDHYGKNTPVADEIAVKKKDLTDDWVEPAPKVSVKKTTVKKEPDPVVVETTDDDWVEDDDGNFVKKGE
jgi:hypothetical protein